MPCVRPDHGVPAVLSEPEGAPRSEPRAARASRRVWRRAVARLWGVLSAMLGLLPGWAWACPTCVARAPESAGRSALLVGALLLVPFLLVAVGVWAAVRVARGDAKRSS
jgi:hypothetical protein